MIYYTYLYKDVDGTPIYVGKGKGDRAFCHIRAKTHLGNVLRKRRKEGYTIKPIITFQINEEVAFEQEMVWIATYGRADLGTGTLFNLTEGGEGKSLSVEARLKAALIKKETPNGMTGKHHTAEARLRMSQARKGKPSPHKGVGRHPLSEEHKLKISAASKGRASRHKGIPRSPETKTKMSLTNTGRRHSDETKAKMALDGRRGRKLSTEAIETRTLSRKNNCLHREQEQIDKDLQK